MKRLIVLAVIGFVTGGLIAYMTAVYMTATSINPEVKTYPIVDKYEHNGKHYIAIEREVTPEEYIGYDVGDDYAD